MSYTTIQQAVRDQALKDRVTAAAMKEAWAGGPEFSESEFGASLRGYPPLADHFMWPTAIDYEAEYEYAINEDNPNPGGDPGVITDANIQASVQAHWKEDAARIPEDTRHDTTQDQPA
jgi:hypothetical protein